MFISNMFSVRKRKAAFYSIAMITTAVFAAPQMNIARVQQSTETESNRQSYSVIPASHTVQPGLHRFRITSFIEKIRADMTAAIAHFAGTAEIPGAAAALYHDGEVVVAAANGIGITDQMAIASTSKFFTGFAMVRLARQGRVDLDAPVSDYLPDFKKVEFNPENPLTVRDLMQQRSGIAYRSSRMSVVSGITIPTPRSEPGVNFEYSNYNYELAGLIISKVHGKPFSESMADLVFKPLGLNDTYVAKYGRGASGIHTTVHDMNELGNYILNDYRVNRDRSFLAEMAARPRLQKEEPDMQYYGIGVRVTYQKGKLFTVYHLGQWYNTIAYLGVYPESQVSTAFILNPPDFRSAKAISLLDSLRSGSHRIADAIAREVSL